MFITFEGIEGSGKTLQIARATEYLKKRGIACVATREPGGTEFGRALRRLLLSTGGPPRGPLSELLLYLADRRQHLEEVIEPALAAGRVVLCDRYHDATRAYQGAARGVGRETIDAMAGLLGIREPDRTLLLDLEIEAGLRRARRRNQAHDSGDEGWFEAEDLSFHQRVREAYFELARRFPERFCVVPAEGEPDEVFARIVPLLDRWLRKGSS